MSSRFSAILLAGGLVFTGAGGFMAATALSQTDEVPTREITIENGERGPAGPPGPQGEKGEPGGTTCPEGYVFGRLIINHPGGQEVIFTCLEGS